MDIAVFPLFYKVGVIFKIVGARMFKDQVASFFYDIACVRIEAKDFVRDCIKSFYAVRGICEHYVERFCTDFEEVENVVADNLHPLDLELGCTLFDESCVQRVHLNAYYVCTSS